jgi:hypothetical protein
MTLVFKQLKHNVLRFQTDFDVATDRYHGTRDKESATDHNVRKRCLREIRLDTIFQ